MISAFGVDHGDYEPVEKFEVPGMARLGAGLGRMAQRGAKQMGGAAGKNLMKNPSGFRQNAQHGLGLGQKTLGQGLKRAGKFAMARPGLTGGLAAGGGVGAVGGAGYSMGNRRRY